MAGSQKWRGIIKESATWRVYPWRINTIVTSACEDSDGNLIIGTLGEGIFWLGADGNWQRISDGAGIVVRLCALLCMDKQGNLWVGTDGAGSDRIKRKIFTLPDKLHPWNSAIVVRGCARRFVGGLWGAGRVLLANQFRAGFSRGPGYQNAWTVLVDHAQQG